MSLMCFNPTMVRLLLSTSSPKRKSSKVFQSHNGAIAAIARNNPFVQFRGFNPTMVRLLR